MEHYTNTLAGPGAKFVVVTGKVINSAKKSMDLTCGWPIATAVIDDQQRHFDTIDELHNLKGNPECNENLQPGFDSDMTWVYRVPENTKVAGWSFQGVTDLPAGDRQQPTLVSVDAP
jgi:hypothetical protein